MMPLSEPALRSTLWFKSLRPFAAHEVFAAKWARAGSIHTGSDCQLAFSGSLSGLRRPLAETGVRPSGQPMTTDLQPLEPSTAKQMYLDERQHELAQATLQSHGYRLKQFVQWCEQAGLDNLNDLTSRDIHRYRVKRRNEDGLATASMKCQLATLRMYLRFCASVDAVSPGLEEKIILPTTTAEDTRDELIEAERAHKILDHLECYRYATLEHALLEVLWNTGLRVGATTGLDIEDYDPEEQSLEIVHRPDTESPLKNGVASERFVAVSDGVSEVLEVHPGATTEYENPVLWLGVDALDSALSSGFERFRYPVVDGRVEVVSNSIPPI